MLFFFCLHIDVDWLCLRPRIEVMTREPHGRRVFEKIMNNCHWLAWIEILSMNEGIPLQKHREQKSITMNEFEWISYGPSVLAVATCGRLLIIIFVFFCNRERRKMRGRTYTYPISIEPTPPLPLVQMTNACCWPAIILIYRLFLPLRNKSVSWIEKQCDGRNDRLRQPQANAWSTRRKHQLK